MVKTRNEKIKEIARFYCYEGQTEQLIEECAKLIQAAQKIKRAAQGQGGTVEETTRQMAEEAADVMIMCEQIKFYLAALDEPIELDPIINKKLDRQLTRIEAEKKKRKEKKQHGQENP